MTARYLKSTTTGVVLPYNKQLELRPNVQALTDEEADAYDVLRGKVTASAPLPEPTPEPVEEETTAAEILAVLEAE